jgi:DNA-binding transcriptional regulator YdaS (Cro superfamily)
MAHSSMAQIVEVATAQHRSAVERAVAELGSQGALADVCGVTQSAVSQWCAGGAIKPRYFPLIAQATSVTAEELMHDEIAKDQARAAVVA